MAAAAKNPSHIAHESGGHAQRGGFGNKEGRDLPLRPADGLQNPNLLRSLDHHFRKVTAHAERRNDQDEQGQKEQRGAKFQDHIGFRGGNRNDGAHVGSGKLPSQRGTNHLHTIPLRTYFDEASSVLDSGQLCSGFERDQ